MVRIRSQIGGVRSGSYIPISSRLEAEILYHALGFHKIRANGR